MNSQYDMAKRMKFETAQLRRSMRTYVSFATTLSVAVCSVVSFSICAANAQDSIVSVAKPGGMGSVGQLAPVPTGAVPGEPGTTQTVPSATTTTAAPTQENRTSPAQDQNANKTETGKSTAAPNSGTSGSPIKPAAPSGVAAPAPVFDAATSAASAQVTQAYDVYRTNPTPATFYELLKAFKQLVSQGSIMKMPAAAVTKAFPVLQDLGVKALDAGPGKVWIFTRVPSCHDAVVQWADVHTQISYVGKRHKVKKVSTSTTWHSQILTVPNDVLLKEARVIGGPEGARMLVLVGDERGSALWVHAFKAADGGWTESASSLDSIPAFLRENVSGKLAFRGADLIFTVAKTVAGTTEGIINQNIPEAESATYRFWLHLTENGYILEQRLPDEDQFGVVHQFLDAVANNRTDFAKSLLQDQKLISIPRYLSLHNAPTAEYRVAELASPPSGAVRFRLVTGGKDDLVFDVGKYKGQTLIKAIFIAPPDPWVAQIAKVLPLYNHITPAPTAASATTGAEPARH